MANHHKPNWVGKPAASRADTIRALRSEGMTLREICQRLGVQKSAVNRALYQKVREYEKVYNRERYYTQTCIRCGAPSTFNKHAKVSHRGLWCQKCYREHRKEALSFGR